MNTHSHEEISKRAERIWQEYGRPEGRDVEIWFEAERRLAADAAIGPVSNNYYPQVIDARTGSNSAERITDETAAESVVEYYISPAIPAGDAVQAALQKNAARAPQVSQSNPPMRAPIQSGKPLWKKPHSS